MRISFLSLSLVIAALVGLVASLTVTAPPATADQQSLFGTDNPGAPIDEDTKPVELGVRFSAKTAGTVSGIRFFKSAEDVGQHVGSLWSPDGSKLASVKFTSESATGWQQAKFATPVRLEAGKTYVASYLAPRGRYVAITGYFRSTYTRSGLLVEPGGGVYTYDVGDFPDQRWQNSNYFVDVIFDADAAGTPSATPSSTQTTAPSQTPSSTPTPSTSASSNPPSPTSSPSATVGPANPGENTTLSLSRIPWEGGPAFWKKFSKTDAAGWDDPSFFPIIAWFNGVSNNAEVAYDKKLGINTYIGMWEGTPYRLFEDNGVFWAGGKLNDTFTSTSKNWVGTFLDDEVDGRFTPAEGRAHLTQLSQQYSTDGRFTYANYTQMVMSKDMKPADAEWYVNVPSDVVSLDMYWYTIPYCSWTPYRDVYLVPVEQKYCRTASSYGKAVSSLRARDAADGQLKPLWQWIENLNGGPGEGPFTAMITPDQLQGAVMNSIIHEARGIAYFNQSFTGPCQGSATFRLSQTIPNYCGAAQVAAAKDINLKIKELAPVLNTQSYVHNFGPGLDTMLKAKDGSIYIFAMVNGSSDPGARSFTLPAEVKGRSVEVMFENRTLQASAGGVFSDSFARENSYHVYRVAV